MDWDQIIKYVTGALAILAILGQAKTHFSSGEKQLSKEIEELKKLITDGNAEFKIQMASLTANLTEHDRRIQALEGELKHLPDRDTAHRLELAMEKISGRLDTLDAKMQPIAATNERMNELLVEQARK